jgi:uncharacterized protein involved in exopolysaccharide biosynthesis
MSFRSNEAPVPPQRHSTETAVSHGDYVENDDSIDVLDVLLTIAENLRWLILWPLVGGAIAYGLTFLLPDKFESTAIIKAENSVASSMTAAHVLDAALKNLGYLDNLSEEQAENARESLRSNISTSVVRGTQLVSLTVVDHSPAAAQRMAQEILNVVYADSKPREVELKRQSAEKSMLEQQIVELTAASKTAQRQLENPTAGANTGALAESIASISSNLVRMQEAIHKVDKKMLGLSAEDLIQAPTLPKKASAPHRPLVAAVCAAVIGLLVLVIVLMRQSWRTSRAFELHGDRVAALKRRYHLG